MCGRANPKLFADAMLGALARRLRMLDLDVAYDPSLDDPELVELSVAQERVILTRDRRLTERRRASNHLLIRSGVVDEQVRQVLGDLGVTPDLGRLLLRCLVCNTPLVPIPTAEALPRVPPFVARTQTEFRVCPGCDRIYWSGTHVSRMRQLVERMTGEMTSE
jgi:uncharacterized protein with PIN domain